MNRLKYTLAFILLLVCGTQLKGNNTLLDCIELAINETYNHVKQPDKALNENSDDEYIYASIMGRAEFTHTGNDIYKNIHLFSEKALMSAKWPKDLYAKAKKGFTAYKIKLSQIGKTLEIVVWHMKVKQEQNEIYSQSIFNFELSCETKEWVLINKKLGINYRDFFEY